MGYNCVFMNIDGGVSGMLVGTEMGTQWDWSTHQVTGKSAAEFAIFFGVFVKTRYNPRTSHELNASKDFVRRCWEGIAVGDSETEALSSAEIVGSETESETWSLKILIFLQLSQQLIHQNLGQDQ